MKTTIIKLITNEDFNSRFAEKLRGFIGNQFKEQVIFHNHLSKYEFLYKSSKIQYKIIDNKLAIVAIDDESSELLKNNILSLKEIVLDEKVYIINDFEIIEKDYNPSIDNELYKYKFEGLWLAINQKNYIDFKNGNFDFNKKLRNNILEFFKSINVWVDNQILVKGEYKTTPIKKKDTILIGTSGTFYTNANLPDYIGLGKRKSIGFGTIKRI
ncbi:MAG: hypothetical protein PWP46_1701 [Fusobacteriaceae bacterium]|jgi:hypothetical protein|nr:hypothetical protein [Fusobacteriales bacterium]MDN5304815.1 hypothetical protein [Fusobacteriaceae bacterium]